MLNGIAPIIIFTFPPPVLQDLFTKLSGLPNISSAIPIGFPVPIYLDENLTGILVDSETRAIDVDTDIQPKYDDVSGKATAGFINQSGISNLVTINMIASKNSLILSVLLTLCDLAFSKLLDTKYRITYLNGSISVFNGFLHGFTTSSSSNDDLLKVSLQLQKPNENKPTPSNSFYSFPRASGATAVPGVT